MIAVSCKLRTKTITSDSIGVQTETVVEKEIPIAKTERIYADEYYAANEQGLKPELRLLVSSLSYNGEPELEYMGTIYTIIRTQNANPDEISLICERKQKNA